MHIRNHFGPANERGTFIVNPSPIGWTYSQNDFCVYASTNSIELVHAIACREFGASLSLETVPTVPRLVNYEQTERFSLRSHILLHDTFSLFLSIFYISQRLTLWYFVFLYFIFLSQQVLYFLLSTLVLTLYIDVVLSLSMKIYNDMIYNMICHTMWYMIMITIKILIPVTI